MNKHLKNIIDKYLIPRYDETSLFIMALSFSLLLITDLDLRSQIASMFHIWDPRDYIAALLIISGIALAVFHMFSDRPKSALEKSVLLFFAIVINATAGMIGGLYMRDHTTGILQIFPMINFINGMLLIFLWKIDYINNKNISDTNSTKSEIFFSVVSVLILFILFQRIQHLHWSAIFSLSVLYATNINSIILSVVSKFIRKLDSK